MFEPNLLSPYDLALYSSLVVTFLVLFVLVREAPPFLCVPHSQRINALKLVVVTLCIAVVTFAAVNVLSRAVLRRCR